MLYHILNILYQKAHTVAAFYIMCYVFNSVFGNAFTFINSIVGFLDGYNYFAAVKVNRRAIALDYLHCPPSFRLCFINII